MIIQCIRVHLVQWTIDESILSFSNVHKLVQGRKIAN